MFSRRDVIALGSASLLWTILGGTPHGASAQSTHGSVPMLGVSASPNGQMPGPTPSLEIPVAIQWRFHHSGTITGSVIVAEGTIFLTSDDGFLYAIDTTTGQERWRFSIGIGSQSTPAYANGMVFTTSSGANFYALDAASGQVRWQFASSEWESAGAEPFSTFWNTTHVTIIDDLVLMDSRISGLHALDIATGQERWNIPWAASPRVAGDTLITDFVSISGYEHTTLTQIWDLDDDRSRNVLAVTDDHVAVWLGAPGSGSAFAPGSTLEILDPKTGIRRWSLEDRHQYLRSGVIVQDLVIVEFVGAFEPNDEEVIALDLATGRERWRVEFIGATKTVPTPMVVIDTTLYRLRGDSQLVAHDVTSGDELWAIPVPVPDNFSWSQPAVVDGVLYVSGDSGVLYALANPKLSSLIQDVTLRGAPSSTAIERGTATAGDKITNVGPREVRDGVEWVEVSIGDVTGWIPLDAIDPTTLPSEGEFEYVYIPE